MKSVTLLLFILLCAGADVQAQHHDAGKNLPVVKPIDHQGLRDLIRSDSGNIVLVNTWASWCKPCQEEMPALVRIAGKYRKQNLTLILVAIDDIDNLQKTIRPMLARLGVSFPSFILQGTPDGEFISAMNPSWSGALPTTFIYDRAGQQTAMLVGGKTYRQFLKALSPMMGGKAQRSNSAP
jgi:thiol-disulfide isomerase/thioredoxin